MPSQGWTTQGPTWVRVQTSVGLKAPPHEDCIPVGELALTRLSIRNSPAPAPGGIGVVDPPEQAAHRTTHHIARMAQGSLRRANPSTPLRQSAAHDQGETVCPT